MKRGCAAHAWKRRGSVPSTRKSVIDYSPRDRSSRSDSDTITGASPLEARSGKHWPAVCTHIKLAGVACCASSLLSLLSRLSIDATPLAQDASFMSRPRSCRHSMCRGRSTDHNAVRKATEDWISTEWTQRSPVIILNHSERHGRLVGLANQTSYVKRVL